MTNYNDGNWHGWLGGECPVHPKTVIVVKWKNGVETSENIARAFAECLWKTGEIIAFRVVKEHREPREFWIVGKCEAYLSLRDAKDATGFLTDKTVIHAREVLE